LLLPSYTGTFPILNREFFVSHRDGVCGDYGAPRTDFIESSENTDGVRFAWNVFPNSRVEAAKMVSSSMLNVHGFQHTLLFARDIFRLNSL
jgi:hypothetical protein